MPNSLRPNLVIEYIDNDVLVLDGQSSTVHRFSGSHAEAIKHLDAGENIEAFSTELADFDAAGLLETESEGSAVSRRGVLLGGSALAGSAALAMSMPAVASAQSANGIIEFSLDDDAEALSTQDQPRRWIVTLRDLPGALFEEGQEWTLRILGFSERSGGIFPPADPLNPTPTRSASVVAVAGYYYGTEELELQFEFAGEGLPEQDGIYQFEVRLEKGNLQSEPFLVSG